MLEAVIFDMDGVIVDTEPFFLRAENELLKQYGHDVPLEYHFQFQGTTHNFMWQTMKDEYDLEETVEDLISKANLLRNALIKKEGLKPISNVLDLIQHLSDEKIPMAIASSSPMEDIQNTVREFNLEDVFDHLISGESVLHSKPAPDIFLKAANCLGKESRNCLVIEDSKNGVLAARAAGMKVVGFYNKDFPPQDLSQATKVLSSFKNLRIGALKELFK